MLICRPLENWVDLGSVWGPCEVDSGSIGVDLGLARSRSEVDPRSMWVRAASCAHSNFRFSAADRRATFPFARCARACVCCRQPHRTCFKPASRPTWRRLPAPRQGAALRACRGFTAQRRRRARTRRPCGTGRDRGGRSERERRWSLATSRGVSCGILPGHPSYCLRAVSGEREPKCVRVKPQLLLGRRRLFPFSFSLSLTHPLALSVTPPPKEKTRRTHQNKNTKTQRPRRGPAWG